MNGSIIKHCLVNLTKTQPHWIDEQIREIQMNAPITYEAAAYLLADRKGIKIECKEFKTPNQYVITAVASIINGGERSK